MMELTVSLGQLPYFLLQIKVCIALKNVDHQLCYGRQVLVLRYHVSKFPSYFGLSLLIA